LEAKWQGPKTGNRDLQSFAGTVHSKSAWTRGLFVSYSGFTDEGLDAFARGNATHIICMDGPELWQVMHRKLNLAEVLTRKARRTAETGRAFVEVNTLYLY
jgi:restriction endonuclease Mrr